MQSLTGRQIERGSAFSLRSQLIRAAWQLVWLVLFRPTPRPLHSWRRLLLRCFGARIHRRARVYPSARVWAPWNLTMGELSCLGEGVDCYCAERITLGDYSTVSQRTFLCTASHDFEQPDMPLITRPIVIERHAWVCAEAFVGMGVTIGEHAVVGARGVVLRDVEPGTVVGGNPARALRAVLDKRVA